MPNLIVRGNKMMIMIKRRERQQPPVCDVAVAPRSDFEPWYQRLKSENNSTCNYSTETYASHICGLGQTHFPPSMRAMNGFAGSTLIGASGESTVATMGHLPATHSPSITYSDTKGDVGIQSYLAIGQKSPRPRQHVTSPPTAF